MLCDNAVLVIAAALVLAGSWKVVTGSTTARIKLSELWRKLQKIRRIERFLYRHHRLFGGFVVVCSAVPLLILGSWHMSSAGSVRLLPSVLQPIEIVVLAFAFAALCVGIFIVVRPSALKPLEEKANLWIEPFPSSERFTVFFLKGTGCLGPRTQLGVALLLLSIGVACLLNCFLKIGF